MRTRAVTLAWSIAIVGVCFWLVVRVNAGPVIDADLLSLLPAAERDPRVQAAAEIVHRRVERKLVMVVSAADETTARAAASYVANNLAASELFVSINQSQDAASLRQLGTFYFPYRFGLLSEQARRDLLSGDEDVFVQRVLSRYINPLSGLTSDLIEADPLLLLSDYLTSLAPDDTSHIRADEGVVIINAESATHVLLMAQLRESPFSMSLQDALRPRLDALRSQLAQEFSGANLRIAGTFPHAAAGTVSARWEVSVIGLGSLCGVILLFLVVFRSLRPLLLGVASISLGCLAGFAACLALFGQVHLLTLVFGASLVGISIDYALHYFSAGLAAGRTTPRDVLARIFPGITLGLATSLIGFGGILVAPFPGLRQMAVFSGVGLIAAWLCVTTLYPLIPGLQARRGAWALRGSAYYGRFWAAFPKRLPWAALGLIVPYAAIGCLQLAPLDDFRLLQVPDPDVLAEDLFVRELLQRDYASQFMLVRGGDAESVLEQEEALVGSLQVLRERGELENYTALSHFVPSPARQLENYRLTSQLASVEGSVLTTLVDSVGLTEETRDAYVSALRQSAGQAPLTLDAWLAQPASAPFRDLWVETEDGIFSVIALSGVQDVAALRDVAAAHPEVTLVDRVGDLSTTFTAYRSKTLWLASASFLTAAMILAFRYGALGALSVIGVPFTAAAIAFGTLGFLSEPISLFNVMAVLLILGIGVDYAIFFREAGATDPTTILAVALSAVTTILAFGLLALSSTLAVHAFGLTLLIGIAAAALLAPLAAMLPSRFTHGRRSPLP